MPDRHKRQPLSLRLPEDTELWLHDQGAATGRSVRAVIADAIREYRQRPQWGVSVEALIGRWRDTAKSLAESNPAWSSHFYDCANELEAAIVAALPVPGQQEAS